MVNGDGVSIIGGDAGDPQNLSCRLVSCAFSASFTRSDSGSLCCWRLQGDLYGGITIGEARRLVQRPFHARQLPGSQPSEMPKEVAFLSSWAKWSDQA